MQAPAQLKVKLRLPGRARPRAVVLRRRVLGAIVSATVLAVLLLGTPLAVAAQRLYRGEEIARLQRDAARVTIGVPDTLPDAARPVRRPLGVAASLRIGVYRGDGARVAGEGPSTSALAASARDGRLHDGIEAGALTVVAPVPSDGGVEVVVRVAAGSDGAADQTHQAWAAIALLALFAVGVATLLGRRQSARISRPLEQLTAAATALGNGDVSPALPPSGIVEADEAAAALVRTASRLDVVLQRQRGFGRDVSHQLRTPLTGLLLGLESALLRPDADLGAAVATAVERGSHLSKIVDEVLTLSEPDVTAERVDFDRLAEDVAARWQGPLAERGRQLRVEVEEHLPGVRAPATAVRQVLDVLLGNALEHGAGRVSLTVTAVGDGVTVEVTDEGAGFPPDVELPPDLELPSDVGSPERAGQTERPRGLGLPLARSLARLAGGRLVIARPAPQPVLRLLLPPAAAGGAGQPLDR